MKRDGKRRPNASGILTQSHVLCKLRKTIIGKLYQTQAFTTFGHFEWGQVIDPTCFKKLDNSDQLYQFLGITYGYGGV